MKTKLIYLSRLLASIVTSALADEGTVALRTGDAVSGVASGTVTSTRDDAAVTGGSEGRCP